MKEPIVSYKVFTFLEKYGYVLKLVFIFFENHNHILEKKKFHLCNNVNGLSYNIRKNDHC